MSDRWVVALAGAAAVGARVPVGLPRSLPLVLVVLALRFRRPAVLCIAVLLLTSSLSHAAWAGLRAPTEYGRFTGVATLVGDPERVGFVVRAGVRIDGHRYEAVASGSAGASLFRRLAGEQIEIDGRFAPLSGNRGWTAAKHYRARIQVERLGGWSSGDPLSRAANRLRRALTTGASSLPPDQRALLSGFVLGDDRAEPAVMVDEFRASGLSHLTAVSGENVAFVLAVAGPLLTRLGLRARLVVTVALLVFFAFVTRFEPSVLRACAMAGLAAWRTYLARQASALRLLALAVTGLLVIDPLLVHSVGFGLSVGASAGIIALGGPIAARVPLPTVVAEPLAVTLAAQIGVLPIGLTVFGTVPVVAIPANLLAVPAAGPVMMWGLTGGLAAGTFARPIAPLLHLPTRLAVGWIALVARVAARVPLGAVGARHLALVVAAVVVGRPLRVRSLAPVMAALVLGSVAVGAHASPVDGAPLGSGARVWVGPGHEAVVVVTRLDAGALAVGLRERGVRTIDVLALAQPPPPGGLDELTRRVIVRNVVVVGPDDAVVVEVGRLRVDVRGPAAAAH